MAHVTLTPATAADFAEMAARSPNTPPLPKVQTIAFALKVDDRVIALGGICFLPNGQRQAFADIGDEARKFPVSLHKAALAGIALARKQKIWRLTATTSSGLERDLRWLLRLGFRKEEGTHNYVLYL